MVRLSPLRIHRSHTILALCLLTLALIPGAVDAQTTPRGGAPTADSTAILFDPAAVALPNVGDTATVQIMVERAPPGTLAIQVHILHNRTRIDVALLGCAGVFEGGIPLQGNLANGSLIACFQFTPITSAGGPALTLRLTRLAPGPIAPLSFNTTDSITQFATALESIVPARINALSVLSPTPICGRSCPRGSTMDQRTSPLSPSRAAVPGRRVVAQPG